MPPYADVSDAILDPALSDAIDVQQRPEVIVAGRSTVPAPVNNVGVAAVVCAASGNDLERLPEEDRTARNISIVTQFRLRATAPGYKPDIVTWPSGTGDLYVVKLVDPYPKYGLGFVQAIAGAISAQDAVTP